jgi:DNA-directed RNA polymerase specialized sigma subunit
MQETLDRLRSRVAELENDQASSSSSFKPSSSSASGGRAGRQDVCTDAEGESAEEQLNALSVIVSNLREELICKEEMIVHERHRVEANAKEHAARLEASHAECSRLNQELVGRPHREDVTALKKQLRVLHSVIFNAELEDDDEAEDIENTVRQPLRRRHDLM